MAAKQTLIELLSSFRKHILYIDWDWEGMGNVVDSKELYNMKFSVKSYYSLLRIGAEGVSG